MNYIYRETDKFIEITANEGYVLTDWDKQDILSYTSTKIMVCPLNYDYSGYYTITDEEDERLMNDQLLHIEIERNK